MVLRRLVAQRRFELGHRDLVLLEQPLILLRRETARDRIEEGALFAELLTDNLVGGRDPGAAQHLVKRFLRAQRPNDLLDDAGPGHLLQRDRPLGLLLQRATIVGDDGAELRPVDPTRAGLHDGVAGGDVELIAPHAPDDNADAHHRDDQQEQPGLRGGADLSEHRVGSLWAARPGV